MQRLEGELEARKKQYAKVRTVAPGTHSQVGASEARVKALEKEITSWDATIVDLRWTVNDLEQGRLNFEYDLSWERQKFCCF